MSSSSGIEASSIPRSGRDWSTWTGRAGATRTSPSLPRPQASTILGGFWERGKPDKDGVWTSNIDASPTLRKWTESVGANYGRVRVIKLEPNSEEETLANLHPDDNNRLTEEGTGWVVRAWLQLTDNPDSFMVLREDRNDPSTEHRIALPAGAQFVLDSERLYHAVWHQGTEPRYALIASFESGPELNSWIEAQRP
jgi:hypothetical protein